MSSAEFRELGERVFGPRWQTPLAKRLHLSHVTVWRYANGLTHVPYTVELALRYIEVVEPS